MPPYTERRIVEIKQTFDRQTPNGWEEAAFVAVEDVNPKIINIDRDGHQSPLTLVHTVALSQAEILELIG